MSRRTIIIAVVVLLIGGFIAWKVFGGDKLPAGFAAGNGRLEANQVYIAAKFPGRIKDVLFDEGDTVEAGQVVARMDTEELEAQLRQAEAQIQQARDTENAATADVATKRARIDSQRAEINARQADYVYADQTYKRSKDLVGTGAVSEQEAQVDSSRMLSTQAQVAGAKAQLVSAQADLTGAQALVGRTGSTIAAAQAEADRIRSQIKDAVLVAPIRGRIESVG
jgi:HlyD family secretion protein